MKVNKKDLQQHNEPWKSRKEWAEGRIQCISHSGALISAIFCLFYNAIIWFVLFLTGQQYWIEFQTGESYIFVFLTVFAIAGIGLIVWASRHVIRWFRFGASVFILKNETGVIGQYLTGQINTKLQKHPRNPFVLTLSCIHHHYPVHGDAYGRRIITRSKSDVLWQQSMEILQENVYQSPSGVAVPVSFFIPFGVKQTDEKKAHDKIMWYCEIHAEYPGTDFKASFHVPVFVTEDSRPETEEERKERLEAIPQPDPSLSFHKTGWRNPVSVRSTKPNEYECIFRPSPSFQTILGTSVITLGMAVILVFGLMKSWHQAILVISGFFLFVFSLGLLMHLFFQTKVIIQNRILTVRKTLLGISKTVRFSTEDISHIQFSKLKKQGSTSSEQDNWDIQILKKDGSTHTVGAMIPDRKQAEWIANELERHMYNARN